MVASLLSFIIFGIVFLPREAVMGLSQVADATTTSTLPRSAAALQTSTTDTSSSSSLSKLLPPLPENFKARIYLVRHAETDWNAEGRIQGCSNDIELNDDGRIQAAEVAEKLHGLPIHLIVSSHLKRSVETADIIHNQIRKLNSRYEELDLGSRRRVVVDGFEEMHFGKLEGVTYKGIPKKKKEIWRLFRAAMYMTRTHFVRRKDGGGTKVPWPGGGESIIDVERRARYALDYILSLNDNNSRRSKRERENHHHQQQQQQQHIVVVSHKQTNKILLASLLWDNALQCEQIRQKSTFQRFCHLYCAAFHTEKFLPCTRHAHILHAFPKISCRLLY